MNMHDSFQACLDETTALLSKTSDPSLFDAILWNLVHKIIAPYVQRCTELENKLHEQENKLHAEEMKLLQQEKSGIEKAVEQLTDAVNKLPTTTVPVSIHHRGIDVPIRGSMSRAKAWTDAIKYPNSKVDVSLPASCFISDSAAVSAIDRRQLEERLVEELGKHARPEEKDIDYEGVVDLFGQYFAALSSSALGDMHVLDTHRQRFLDDLAPDLVLQRSSKNSDKFNIAAVLDLKGIGDDGHAKLNTATNLGQILDYLTAIEYYQLGRTIFLGLLTNLRDAYLIRYQTNILKGRSRRTSGNQPYTSKLTQYRKVPLCDALRYLYEQLQDPAANPPQLPFSESAGELSYVVQRHSKSVVAVFNRQNAQIIVKASPEVQWNSGIQNEIICLKSLQGDSRPASIPKLIYSTYDMPGSAFVEFGISPPGRPLQLELFREASDFRTCLQDILVALKWVHDHGIVHRDVRGDNIIVFDGLDVGGHSSHISLTLEIKKRRLRAMLIDFDRATNLGISCHYEGGYICCPRDLLQQCTRESEYQQMVDIDEYEMPVEGSTPLSNAMYIPEKRHDYLSFVLLVNTVIFPFTLQGYINHLVEVPSSREQRRLLNLWGELESKEPWSSLVREAQNAQADVQVWSELLGLLVWL
ncbi:hypothetical protein L211DRAFT_871566 [Terfezia boudieri ATCC MYA-4762]|uniref:EKC/KEOPS complex subunit BUD32 n=1 Tax=Terfezia boudieri ATCC MYA-4762 TaxID=1051890 RepID=A0A3N4LLV1_9PEZI|nr:hypothetical protein L211DRAFT_871566 [Terfezia boudieri ATCC MYA-4762]